MTSSKTGDRVAQTHDYVVNGHQFEITKTFDHSESVLVECTECLQREALDEDDDPDEYLGLVSDECHIEWLRKPEGRSRGVALRNSGCFRGRELISVDSDGEVTDRVRVYDDDAPLLASMLDKSDWERREQR